MKLQHTFATLVATTLAAGTAAATDSDGDGIDDAIEIALADQFAPHLRLHPDEDHNPATVGWYLSRLYEVDNGFPFGVSGGLRFQHGSPCEDHTVLASGLHGQNLHIHEHQLASFNLFFGWCEDNGATSWSDSLLDPSPQTSYFLEMPEDSTDVTTRAGLLPGNWEAYVHVSESRLKPDHYDVQYHWFYPYNDLYAIGGVFSTAGGHQGDWEHITVRVEADMQTIDAIHFAAHGSDGSWYEPGEFLLHPVTGRPIVYAAENSHASYPAPGSYTYDSIDIGVGQFPLIDITADGGDEQDMLGSLVHVGELPNPTSGQEWVRYSGRWGDLGDDGLIEENVEGPHGPATYGSWSIEVVGDELPPSNYRWVCVGPDTGANAAYSPYSSIQSAQANAPAGSKVWLQHGDFDAPQVKEFVVPAGYRFDQPMTFTTGVAGAARIVATP